MNKPPPRWIDRFLQWRLPDEQYEEVQGDMHELYHQWVAEVGERKAGLKYALNALTFLRPLPRLKTYSQPSSLYPTMFRNYLITAFRNLTRQKAFSFINIIGLATGLACFTVILLFVSHEYAFDRFHHQPEQVYRVASEFVNDDATRIPTATSPPALAPVLQKDLPEVAHTTRLYVEPGNTALVKYGSSQFYETGLLRIDSSFFKVFDFPFHQGDPASAFGEPNAVLLTQTMAKKYFGNGDPIGQTLKLGLVDGERDFIVTGVLKDVPSTAHFTFSLLIPLRFEANFVRDDLSSLWFWYNFYTYVRLRPGTDPDAFTAKLQPLVQKYVSDNKNQFYTQALTDIHLHSARQLELATNGDATYVQTLMMIAVLVLVLAGINYVNLVTAQSARRAKEIGIRKVAGAFRHFITAQFLIESVLTALLAFVVAIGAVLALLPVIGNLMGATLSLVAPESIQVWPVLIGIVVAVGLLAGLYPALYLSAFEPVQVLKGSFVTSRQGIFLRKGLVVFQFVISISLLTGTLLIARQLNFMREKKVGFDQENIVIVPNAAGLQNRQALVGEWKNKPDVVKVGAATGVFGGGNWTIVVKAKDKPDELLLNFLVVDYDFLPVMNVAFQEGRNFSPQFGTDTTAGVVLNEAAVRQLGLKEPVVGQQIEWNVGGDRDNFKQVIGVVEDFHFSSFREAIKPFGFVANLPDPGNLFIKVRSDDLAATVADLQASWEKLVPERPFTYRFQDEQMAALHQAEAKFHRLFVTLTGLAIMIGCLGLLGLTMYTVKQRHKEIAVRKVLGANTTGIVGLIAGDFVVPVLIAFTVATPIAYYFMHEWLAGFAYHVDLSWWLFAVAGAGVMSIALLTVSFQAIKAALANPVNSLRSE